MFVHLNSLWNSLWNSVSHWKTAIKLGCFRVNYSGKPPGRCFIFTVRVRELFLFCFVLVSSLTTIIPGCSCFVAGLEFFSNQSKVFTGWLCRPPLRYPGRQHPSYLKSGKSSLYGRQASNQVSGMDLKGLTPAREHVWFAGEADPRARGRLRASGQEALPFSAPARRASHPRGAQPRRRGRGGRGRLGTAEPLRPAARGARPLFSAAPSGGPAARGDPCSPSRGRAGRPRGRPAPAVARPRPRADSEFSAPWLHN